MSRHSFIRGAAIALAAVATSCLAYAQSVPAPAPDVPRIISYQGVVTTANGTAVSDGTHRITITFYENESGSSPVWQETYPTATVGGLFSIDIGGVGKALPGNEMFGRPLWVGIAVDGSEEMRPLTRLTSSPYALAVPDKSITARKLADGAVTAEKLSAPYVSEIQVNGEKVGGNGAVVNFVGGKDVSVAYDSEKGNIVIGKAEGVGVQAGKKDGDGSTTLTTDKAWFSAGDLIDVNTGATSMIGANDWLGTSNAANLELRVNNQRIMRYQPNSPSTPNIVGGDNANSIPSNAVGSIIAGGGSATLPNTIYNVTYNTISGGEGNEIGISGSPTPTVYATIAGGVINRAEGDFSFIGGGEGNLTQGNVSVIVGGDDNATSNDYSIVVGGHNNLADGALSFIGGGGDIQHLSPAVANLAHGDYSAVVGGYHDTASGDYSFVGSGRRNHAIGALSGVAAGDSNKADGTSSFIGGGFKNVTSANYGTIGGGRMNEAHAQVATIAGGDVNAIHSIGGAIGGGTGNVINPEAIYSVIAGGNQNVILPYAIGGAIGGGLENQIGTGVGSANPTTSYASIGGGYANVVYTTADFGTIGGGVNNRIASAGMEATIVGGEYDTAQSYGQVVMGVWNRPRGSVPFRYNGGTAAGYNDPIVIVGNGNPTTRSTAFEVSYNGHSIVYDRADQGTATYRGATYTDNVIYAWGDVVVAGGEITSQCTFASNVTRRGTGWYRVVLNNLNPDDTRMSLSCGSVTATLSTGEGPSNTVTPAPACPHIRVTRIGSLGGGTIAFDVFVSMTVGGICEFVDQPFQYKVTGRPSTE